MAFGRFWPFPKTRFGPGTPETGPNRVFAAETQQLYGKRVTWVHSGPFGLMGPAGARSEKLFMHQNISYLDSNIHFEPLGLLGGSLGGQNLQGGVGGGFLEVRALVFFQMSYIGPLKRFWMVF